MRKFLFLFACTNSCANPLIYGVFTGKQGRNIVNGEGGAGCGGAGGGGGGGGGGGRGGPYNYSREMRAAASEMANNNSNNNNGRRVRNWVRTSGDS